MTAYLDSIWYIPVQVSAFQPKIGKYTPHGGLRPFPLRAARYGVGAEDALCVAGAPTGSEERDATAVLVLRHARILPHASHRTRCTTKYIMTRKLLPYICHLDSTSAPPLSHLSPCVFFCQKKNCALYIFFYFSIFRVIKGKV